MFPAHLDVHPEICPNLEPRYFAIFITIQFQNYIHTERESGHFMLRRQQVK
jgi:hypothetical protein